MKKLLMMSSLLLLPFFADAKSCSCSETENGQTTTISYQTDKGTSCCSPTGTQARERIVNDNTGAVVSDTFITINEAIKACC